MTQFIGYDPDSVWENNINHENIIDYFFTQRKITEYEEIVDKSLERKTKKKIVTHNFLAINLPNNLLKNIKDLSVDIEIWGDKKYHYKGRLQNMNGTFPSLLVKLDTDKELFVKLFYKDENSTVKNIVKFIPILKRYQSAPE